MASRSFSERCKRNEQALCRDEHCLQTTWQVAPKDLESPVSAQPKKGYKRFMKRFRMAFDHSRALLLSQSDASPTACVGGLRTCGSGDLHADAQSFCFPKQAQSTPQLPPMAEVASTVFRQANAALQPVLSACANSSNIFCEALTFRSSLLAGAASCHHG